MDQDPSHGTPSLTGIHRDAVHNRRGEAFDRLLDVIADHLVQEYLKEIENGDRSEGSAHE